VAALIGAGALGGCDDGGAPEESAAPDNAADTAQSQDSAQQKQAAAPAAGVEGEGQVAPADPATDDVAYLTQLGLMRGHLLVGVELFRAEALDQSATHMKHPENELYAKMKPAFQARGADGFADQLAALAMAVESGASAKKVESAYRELLAAIDAAEGHVAQADPAVKLKVAVNLVRTAGIEYGIGVKKGEIVNLHEYQDAYGFTQTAKMIVNGIDTSGNADLAAAVKDVKVQLAGLDGAWPGITEPGRVETDAAQIHGAAARMEIAALSVE